MPANQSVERKSLRISFVVLNSGEQVSIKCPGIQLPWKQSYWMESVALSYLVVSCCWITVIWNCSSLKILFEMAIAASQYNDLLERSVSARTKCSVNVSKLTDIPLGSYYLLSIWCGENADMLAFVYFFSCLLRPWPFAVNGIHTLTICLKYLSTTEKQRSRLHYANELQGT